MNAVLTAICLPKQIAKLVWNIIDCNDPRFRHMLLVEDATEEGEGVYRVVCTDTHRMLIFLTRFKPTEPGSYQIASRRAIKSDIFNTWLPAEPTYEGYTYPNYRLPLGKAMRTESVPVGTWQWQDELAIRALRITGTDLMLNIGYLPKLRGLFTIEQKGNAYLFQSEESGITYFVQRILPLEDCPKPDTSDE